jgi:hypothetical protein
MVRRGTWILIVVLVVLVGLSLFLQRTKSNEVATPTATSSTSPLFGVAPGEPTTIRIENAAGDAVEVARGAGGKWQVTAPNRAEADQAAAEAAATQIGALKSLSVVRLAPAVVGLERPQYTLIITFADGAAHTLLVGALTPTQDGYYTQLDDGSIQVVDKFGLDELARMLVAPPYPATPTLAASATPVALATSAAETQSAISATPTVTVSP